MMILEVARPGGQQFTKALAGSIVSASVSFGVYFAIAGAFFVDAYQVPTYDFDSWQLLVAVGLGLFAALAFHGWSDLYLPFSNCVSSISLKGRADAGPGPIDRCNRSDFVSNTIV